MRTCFLAVAILFLELGSCAAAGSKGLDGCATPGDIASALATVRERGWTVWTPEELVKIWPRPLIPQDCHSPQGPCALLGYKGRGGKQSCECCETFDFSADRDGGGPKRLNAVTVFHSAERYTDVLAAARQLAKAMGLPASEGPVGQEQQPAPGETVIQHFEWKEAPLKQGAVLDLRISHEKVWTAYVTVGWYPVI